MTDSIFTKIIKREIPANIIYEDEYVVAFEDVNPVAPIHILVVPKKQIPTMNDANEEDTILLGKILLTAGKLAKQKGVSEDGYRLVINCNKGAGQTVFHIHCHLLGGRIFNWPPG
ncbi:MAG: histidine triad nucleotide-binding protein [Ignavibacteria bacterium GWB2_35_12]|nr:MAG: histidine triad nucleotide-binding protein [Ignavibacteria bacterium GWA2_35_8]OGU39843.1 MAG: histidine triad nucleotide-binding protein [Ignavibacteria bacterium GWB2_35_12]OGU96237.1 MAG: histidine triad nucleotide-binding protein [Ignavibacteria bacterium RIFOXYA2_FULL_35_10]OGV21474.1 MAG: histidine triad nucleotide-binding protein [Ignavibacteria bacterium RIFOXYC2_FULL_35_21]